MTNVIDITNFSKKGPVSSSKPPMTDEVKIIHLKVIANMIECLLKGIFFTPSHNKHSEQLSSPNISVCTGVTFELENERKVDIKVWHSDKRPDNDFPIQSKYFHIDCNFAPYENKLLKALVSNLNSLNHDYCIVTELGFGTDSLISVLQVAKNDFYYITIELPEEVAVFYDMKKSHLK